MEDLPLESDGYVHMEFGFRPARNVEGAVGMGPYDSAMIGLKGHLWISPAAALQIRASMGGMSQYNAAARVTAGSQQLGAELCTPSFESRARSRPGLRIGALFRVRRG
jgi:hypothetical protein